MSSRFVSGGTITSSGEPSKDESGHEAVVAAAREPLMKKNAEWEAVQHELEEDRKKREQARANLAGEGQQSLYDVLQANKGLFFLRCGMMKACANILGGGFDFL